MKTKYKLIMLLIALFIVLATLFSIKVFNKDKESFETINTKDFKLQPGDIIITKGPVLFGFFGHSSIAIDEDTVLQIEGLAINL